MLPLPGEAPRRRGGARGRRVVGRAAPDAPGARRLRLGAVRRGASAEAGGARTRALRPRPAAHAQYFAWMARAARLDFGVSLVYHRPVARAGRPARRSTPAILALAALLLATRARPARRHHHGQPAPWARWPSLIRAASLVLLSLPSLVMSLRARAGRRRAPVAPDGRDADGRGVGRAACWPASPTWRATCRCRRSPSPCRWRR